MASTKKSPTQSKKSLRKDAEKLILKTEKKLEKLAVEAEAVARKAAKKLKAKAVKTKEKAKKATGTKAATKKVAAKKAAGKKVVGTSSTADGKKPTAASRAKSTIPATTSKTPVTTASPNASWTVTQLRTQARSSGLTGYSRLGKDALLAAVTAKK